MEYSYHHKLALNFKLKQWNKWLQQMVEFSLLSYTFQHFGQYGRGNSEDVNEKTEYCERKIPQDIWTSFLENSR